MTQIGRYAHMLKVDISKVRAHVKAHFGVEGSVLNDTVSGGCSRIETDFQVESSEPPERVAAVLRNARNGCFIRQAVAGGVPFDDTVSLNGQPFDATAYPPLEAGVTRS